MVKNYRDFLCDEYKRAGIQQISVCTIGNEEIVVPVSYRGNKNKFFDDLFNYEKEASSFENYNNKNKNTPLDPLMIQAGEISFLPPFDLYSKGLSIDDLTQKALKRALRRYHSAIKTAKRLKKEYPNKEFFIEFNADFISKLKLLHQQHIRKQIQKKLKSILKSGVSQAVNMTAGALGALPAVVYMFLDKKVHFPKNNLHSFISKKAIPYIFKGALKDLCLLSAGITINKQLHQEKVSKRITVEVTDIVQRSPSMDSNQTFKIADEESFKTFFELAVPYAIKSLLPTESLVYKPYSDNGKSKNSIGIGNYLIPENYDPKTYDPCDPAQKSVKWIPVSSYLKKHPDLELTGEQAFKLAKGVFYCHHYYSLFNSLKETELTIPQLTAIMSCMYNSPISADKLCQFIQKNWKDPYKCAEFLLNLKPKGKQFTAGITKRHAFEALLYLNPDNFADKLDYFSTKEGVSSFGDPIYITAYSALEPADCKKLMTCIKTKNAEGIKEISKIITDPFPIKEKTLRDVIYENNMEDHIYEKHDVSFEQERLFMYKKQLYEDAKKLAKKKEYRLSIAKLQLFLATGAENPEIHNCLAENYYHLKEYDKCLDECSQVTQTGNPLYVSKAYYYMGKVHEENGKPALACINYKSAINHCNDSTTLKTYQRSYDKIRSFQLLASNVRQK